MRNEPATYCLPLMAYQAGHVEQATRDQDDLPDNTSPPPYLPSAHRAKIAIWESLK
jgi:hypothetical protein